MRLEWSVSRTHPRGAARACKGERTMAGPDDPAGVHGTDWGRLAERAERFEDACRRFDSVNLGDFLPRPGDPLRTPVLHELIKTDLEVRWRSGRGRTLEDYS